MPTDFLKLAPTGLRSNFPWVLFLFAVVLQGIAMRMLTHRNRVLALPIGAEPDIVASESLPGFDAAASDVPRMAAPIAGAHVPTDPGRLPGAVRSYRGGVHEGVDFSCVPNTPVIAAADGWVLTIEDEPDLPESQRNELLSISRTLGETPPEVLRALHGRRITLRHETGEGHLLTTSYSHLASIRVDLKPGTQVHEGDVLGAAGSSGTSHSYRRDGWGEVHFELRIDGRPLGLGRPPLEAANLYRDLLGEGR